MKMEAQRTSYILIPAFARKKGRGRILSHLFTVAFDGVFASLRVGYTFDSEDCRVAPQWHLKTRVVAQLHSFVVPF